jgi:GWxTD domain-containing protein
MSPCSVPSPPFTHCHSERPSEGSRTARTSATRDRLCYLLAAIVFLASLSAGAQLQTRYKKWLDEDASWIITSQERADFMNLSSDDQREKFIVDFWERHNPSPGSPENAFKQEHYRRIAYANAHFDYTDKKGNAAPGWKTDRGRIYILYGTPDSIDNRAGGGFQLASGIKASADPFVLWHYKSIRGIGQNVTVRFIDKCRCGDLQQSGDIEVAPSGSEE